MKNATIAATLNAPVRVESAGPGRLSDYWTLMKPGIVGMVSLTCLVGYLVGAEQAVVGGRLFAAILGTSLAAAGGACFNMALEWRVDGRMERTVHRPLPAGRLNVAEAWALGVLLSVAGLALLALETNRLAAGLAAGTLAVYAAIYTPLKVRSQVTLLIGAVSGALPPLIGYAAAAGHLSARAWVLFAVLFFWQMPHFLALGWLYRGDYARAGMRFPAVTDPTGRSTSFQAALFAMLLAAAAVSPALLGASAVFTFLSALQAAGFLAIAFAFAVRRTEGLARGLFMASIVYLPAVLSLFVLDRIFTL